MNIKLQENFRTRLPIVIYQRNGIFYYQLQINIVSEDGIYEDTYHEFYKFTSGSSAEEIGTNTKEVMKRFQLLGDLSVEEFQSLTGQILSDYRQNKGKGYLEFMNAKSPKEIKEKYNQCIIAYDVKNEEYMFRLSWTYKEGSKILYDCSESTGEEDVLIFEKPLNFKSDVEVKHLGEMVMEAFDRGQRMAEKMSGNYYPTKNIELLDETVLEITAPSDDYFVDYEDNGMSEVYQLYSYITKKSDQASAYFALTVAPEIYGDLSTDTIYSDWISAFGEADEITVTQKEYGIFNFRAQMKNKKVYRIAYFAQCQDNLILECCMEIPDPAKKKKLVESLLILFEQFAFRCKKAIDK